MIALSFSSRDKIRPFVEDCLFWTPSAIISQLDGLNVSKCSDP